MPSIVIRVGMRPTGLAAMKSRRRIRSSGFPTHAANRSDGSRFDHAGQARLRRPSLCERRGGRCPEQFHVRTFVSAVRARRWGLSQSEICSFDLFILSSSALGAFANNGTAGQDVARYRNFRSPQRLAALPSESLGRSPCGSCGLPRKSGRRSSARVPWTARRASSAAANRRKPPSDREHLLLTARQGTGELSAPFAKRRKERINAIQICALALSSPALAS